MQEFDVICSECGNFFPHNKVTHVGHECYCNSCYSHHEHDFDKVAYHPRKTHKVGLFIYGFILGLISWFLLFIVLNGVLESSLYKWKVLLSISEFLSPYKTKLLLGIPLTMGFISMLSRKRVNPFIQRLMGL